MLLLKTGMVRSFRRAIIIAALVAVSGGVECPSKNQQIVTLLPQWGRQGEIGLATRLMHKTLGEGGLHTLYRDHVVHQGTYAFGVEPIPNTLKGVPDLRSQCLTLDLNTQITKASDDPLEVGVTRTPLHIKEDFMEDIPGTSGASYALWRAMRVYDAPTRVAHTPRIWVAALHNSLTVVSLADERVMVHENACAVKQFPSVRQLNDSASKQKHDKVVLLRLNKDVVIPDGLSEHFVTLDYDSTLPPEERFAGVRKVIELVGKSGDYNEIEVTVIYETTPDKGVTDNFFGSYFATEVGEFAQGQRWNLILAGKFNEPNEISNPDRCFSSRGNIGQHTVNFKPELLRDLPDKEDTPLAHALGKLLHDNGAIPNRKEGPLFVFVVAGTKVNFGSDGWRETTFCHPPRSPSWAYLNTTLENLNARLIVITPKENEEEWRMPAGDEFDRSDGKALFGSFDYQATLEKAKDKFLNTGEKFSTVMLVQGGFAKNLDVAEQYWELKDSQEHNGYLAYTHTWDEVKNDNLTRFCYGGIGYRDGMQWYGSDSISRNLKHKVDVKDDSKNPITFAILRRLYSDPDYARAAVKLTTKRLPVFAAPGTADSRDWAGISCSAKVLPTQEQFIQGLEALKATVYVFSEKAEVANAWAAIGSNRVLVGVEPAPSGRALYLADAGDLAVINQQFTDPHVGSFYRSVAAVGDWELDGEPTCLIGRDRITAVKNAVRNVQEWDDKGVVSSLAHTNDQYSYASRGALNSLYLSLLRTQNAPSGPIVFVVDLDGVRFDDTCKLGVGDCAAWKLICRQDFEKAVANTKAAGILLVGENAGALDSWFNMVETFPIKVKKLLIPRKDCISAGDRINEAVCNFGSQNYKAADCSTTTTTTAPPTTTTTTTTAPWTTGPGSGEAAAGPDDLRNVVLGAFVVV